MYNECVCEKGWLELRGVLPYQMVCNNAQTLVFPGIFDNYNSSAHLFWPKRKMSFMSDNNLELIYHSWIYRREMRNNGLVGLWKSKSELSTIFIVFLFSLKRNYQFTENALKAGTE
ncbi:hypothetical protein DMENIID0001_108570 [Sergentomyia squamirostris]